MLKYPFTKDDLVCYNPNMVAKPPPVGSPNTSHVGSISPAETDKKHPPVHGDLGKKAAGLRKIEQTAKGKPKVRYTFYHFWSTTCHPCMKELSSVVALAKELAPFGVEVHFVAEETSESMAAAKTEFVEHGGDLSTLQVLHTVDSRRRKALGLGSDYSPATSLASPNFLKDHKILLKIEGRLSEKDFKSLRDLVQKGIPVKG